MEERRMGTTQEAEETLSSALDYLQFLTRRLRRLGLLIFLGTSLNLVVMLGARASLTYFAFRSFFLGAGALSLVVMGLTVLHDQTRRTADTLFDEISDEFQWKRQAVATAKGIPHHAPHLEARITLRNYTAAADLPLVPGRYGPGVYLLLNLAGLAVFAVPT